MQALILAAKVHALLAGRANVATDDVDRAALAALNHRLVLNFAAEAEGVSQRLVVYKRLAAIRGVPDLDEIAAELVDRYGPVPALVDTLMRLMELRRWLKDLRIVAARRRGERIVLEFSPTTPVRPETLVEAVHRSHGRLRLVDGATLAVAPEATDHDGTIAELRALLQRLASA